MSLRSLQFKERVSFYSCDKLKKKKKKSGLSRMRFIDTLKQKTEMGLRKIKMRKASSGPGRSQIKLSNLFRLKN